MHLPLVFLPTRRLCALVALSLLLLSAGCEQMGRDFDRLVGAESDPVNAYKEARRLDEAGDDAAAVRLYRRAAEAGNAEAAYELGEAYWLGEGVERDLPRAADWFNRAADGGSPRGQYLLGRAYAEGRGVDKEPATAARFFGRAATQGHAPAQYELGRAFANGIGVPQDRLWAGRWYGKAARQGHVDAQVAYGALLAAGEGVERDLQLGYAFLTVAAENGSERAQEVLPRLRSQLSPQRRRAAEPMIAEIRNPPVSGFADKPTVRYVQAALNRLGFEAGPVDGLMGPKTRAGIQSYQRARGREVDGELDPDLLQAILDDMRAAA